MIKLIIKKNFLNLFILNFINNCHFKNIFKLVFFVYKNLGKRFSFIYVKNVCNELVFL